MRDVRPEGRVSRTDILHVRSSRTAYFMAAPALLVFGFYVIYPILHTCVLSAYSWDAAGPQKRYLGLANYTALAHDPFFGIALKNNVLFIVLSLIVQLPLAFLLAVAAGSALRRHRAIRTAFFAPFIMPIVAVGLIWQLIFEPNFGALNTLLRMAHLPQFAHGWLGDPPGLAIWSIIAVSNWRFVGYHMMILLAGLQAIPEEFYEAARLDGCTGSQVFRHVTVPLMRRVVLVDALLIAVGSIKIFDLVQVMTGGGPNHASEVLATYMYRTAFTEGRMGYAAAIAVVMLVLTLIATVVYVRVTRGEEVGEL